MKLDTESLAHTKWNCKYHIVFAPKYRRQVIYGKIKQDVGIRNHLVAALGNVQVRDITPRLLQQFYNFKAEQGLAQKR